MSGGVDSSVSACLLAEAGYEVVGSHMNLVHLDGVEHGCCGPQARADAAAVARIAGIDFEVVDMSGVFERTVLADFFAEHEAGRTPNPCVRCNERIKFGAFLSRADELGIDLVATGHYVRSSYDDAGGWRLLSRRGPREGPVLRPAHARPAPAREIAIPRRGNVEVGDARARRALRASGGGEAGLPGGLFRPRSGSRCLPRGARSSSLARGRRRRRGIRRGPRAARGLVSVHRRAAPRAGDLEARTRATWSKSTRQRTGSWSAPSNCSPGGGWSPTGCRGSPASLPGRVRSRLR